MTMEPTPTSALDKARRAAEAALAGSGTDPQLKAQRSLAKEAIETENLPTPARLTRSFAYVLDDRVQIPGPKIRIGVDPLLSLVPWAGTAVGATFGGVVLLDAIRLRAPVSVIARMVGNSILDWLLGMVPFVGAFFDVTFRANKKNLKLLNRTIADRELVRQASAKYWLAVGGLVLLVLIAIVAITVAIIMGVSALLNQ